MAPAVGDDGRVPSLRLNLFGTFRVLDAAGGEIAVRSAKGRALLAYLAMHAGEACPREHLATWLWPDRGHAQGRQSLRQALLTLRRSLGDHAQAILVADDDGVKVDPKAIDIDIVTFLDLIEVGEPLTLRQAMEIYRNDFLDGLNPKSAAFDAWATGERARLRDLACEALKDAAANPSGGDDFSIWCWNMVLNLDASREDAYRDLMRAYYVTGRSAMALRLYAECREALRRELDTEPSAQTASLFEAIRSKSLAMEADPAPASASGAGAAPAQNRGRDTRPSIAVLPFRNASPDPEQDYFGEGISERIISELGRFRWFFVVSRHSTFGFRDSDLDITEIAENLGVRYVLDGSVRRSADKARITANLTDARNGNLVWSEHYEFELEDLFDVQDRITQAVITQAFPRFLQSEAERAMTKDVTSLDSWDLMMRARWHLWRFNKEDIKKSQALIEEVLEKDELNAMALADLAGIHLISGLYGWSPSAPASLQLAYQTAEAARSLDEQDAWTYSILGLIEACMRNHDAGLRHLRKAIQINPNFSFAYGFLGLALAFSGMVEEAREAIDETIRLSPFDQFMAVWFIARAAAAFVNEDYDEAIVWAQRSVEERRDFPSGQRLLAASFGMSNRSEEARRAVKEILRLIPDQTVQNLRIQLPYGDPEVVERFLEGLRRGGLPEE